MTRSEAVDECVQFLSNPAYPHHCADDFERATVIRACVQRTDQYPSGNLPLVRMRRRTVTLTGGTAARAVASFGQVFRIVQNDECGTAGIKRRNF